jgi:hypothetical protein
MEELYNEGSDEGIEKLIKDNMYIGPYEEDNEFILFINNKEIVTTIKDINNEIGNIFFTDEDIILDINVDGFIKLKTNDYEIIEIYKVKSIPIEKLPEVSDILLTKDVYPKLKIEVTEIDKQKYHYSKVEKKESLISSIIASLDIYDNYLLIKKISLMADDFVNMIEDIPQDDIKNLYNSHFNKIHNFIKNEELPHWLHPISNNKLKIYVDETEPLDEGNTYFSKYFEKEMLDFKTNEDNSNNYLDTMKLYYDINNYPLQNIDINDGYHLINYTGSYFRSCIVNECNYYSDTYSIDYRKNNENLLFPYLIDNNYERTIIGDTSGINLNGFLLFSENEPIKLPFELFTDTISLKEKSMMIENFYSNYTIKDKFTDIINNNLYSEVITGDSYDYDSNKSYGFRIPETIYSSEALQDILYNYIPNHNKIINNYPNNYLYNYIFNYSDIEKIFIKYDIKVKDINKNDKINFNNIIQENIKNYKNIYKGLYKEKVEIEVKEKQTIDVLKKIVLLKDYIYSELNENIRLFYLKKFIEQFTRLPNELTEDKRWLYNKYNDDKLLCKHHVISSKIIDDDTAYTTLIDEYGDAPVDGNIYCKVCHEYLAPEDFSLFEGFEDDKPIIKESLQEGKETVSKLDPESIDGKNYEIIKVFGNSLGVKLIDYDILEILNIYNNGFGLPLFYKRYNVNGESAVKSIGKLYGMNTKDFNIFFNNTNKVLLLYVAIIIYVQTATPSYNSRGKIELLNLDDDKFKKNPESIIKDRIVNSILSTIRRMESKFSEDIMWQQVKIFYQFQSTKILNPDEQIKNTIKYLLQYRLFPQIFDRINKYQEYNGITKDLKLKEYWTVYRPLYTNDTIEKINKVINDSVKTNSVHMIKNTGTSYDLENVTMIQSMKDYIKTYKYQELKIKNIDILNNISFYRLYEYLEMLYGEQPDNLYMNLLINRLIETSENKNYIEKLLKDNGWDKGFSNSKISFHKLRNILNIDGYCKKEDIDCIRALVVFKHISLNNCDLSFINTLDKRIYKYNPYNAYPTNKWEDVVKTINEYEEECINDPEKDNDKDCIIETNIRNFFNNFCYDVTGKLIKKPKSEIRYRSIYIDVDTTYNPCNMNKLDIEANNENFKEVINIYHTQNIIKGIYYKKPKTFNYFTIEDIKEANKKEITEKRIIYGLYNYSPSCIISSGNCILESENTKHMSELYNLVENYVSESELIDEIPEEDKKKFTKEYYKILSDINNKSELLLRELIEHIKTNDSIPRDLKNRISNQNLFNSLRNVINNNENENYSLNTQLLYNYIRNIVITMSRIKNNDNIPNNFHSHISEHWKLSDYNKDKLKEFIESKEFLLHNQVFNPTSNKYKGFYNYLGTGQAQYFKDIFDLILPYTQNIGVLIGSTQQNFVIMKYIFILILYKFTIYLDELSEEEDGPDYLDDDTEEKHKNVSIFYFDMILNIIEEYNDPMWFISINNKGILQEKLRAQSEREKQSLINKLELMDKDQRFANIQLQNVGDGHWYQDAAKENAELVEGAEWEIMNRDERQEAFAGILEENPLEEGIDESGFINDFRRHVEEDDVSVGYGRDEDFESEGGDDDEEQLDGPDYD